MKDYSLIFLIEYKSVVIFQYEKILLYLTREDVLNYQQLNNLSTIFWQELV
jgi:hypothetical protein